MSSEILEMPTEAQLEAIRATNATRSLFRRKVGLYTLSVVYRESSALGAHGDWYPESVIMEGEWGKDDDGRTTQWPRIRFQGEGWGAFSLLTRELTTVEQIEAFLGRVDDADDQCDF